MEETEVQGVQSIDLMEPGDYYILDPAWDGQQTVYITRPDERPRWVIVSEYSRKAKRKDTIQVLLSCAVMIGLGFFIYRAGYSHSLFYYVIIVIGIAASIIYFMADSKKTVLECEPWQLKLRQRNAFKTFKAQWNLDEIRGFEFTECGDSVPKKCTQQVYDLKLKVRNDKKITLLYWQPHPDLSWIAEGLQRILRLKQEVTRTTKAAKETQGNTNKTGIDVEALQRRLSILPKSDCLNISTDIIEKEDEQDQATFEAFLINIKMAYRLPHKLLKPLVALLFILILPVIIALSMVLADSGIENEVLDNTFTGMIVCVSIFLIIIGTFLWTYSSEVKQLKAKILTNGKIIHFWSGKNWIHMAPEQLERFRIVSTKKWAYFVGIGINQRKLFRLGKAYAIEIVTQENMITTAEMPFDHPECEYICYLLKIVKEYTE